MYVITRGGLGDDSAPLAPFAPSVEAWRDRVSRYAGDLPVDFLLAWIQRESGGNVCSYTSLRESGIFQLEPPDNTNTAGTTEAALRPACAGQQMTRPFTDDELDEQVKSGIRYVNAMRKVAHAKLDSVDVTWPESSADFWRVVKLQHAYPGPTVTWLENTRAQLGRPAASWAEFRATNLDARQDVLNNAEWVGSYGDGGGGIQWSPGAIMVAGAAGLLAYLLLRKRR